MATASQRPGGNSPSLSLPLSLTGPDRVRGGPCWRQSRRTPRRPLGSSPLVLGKQKHFCSVCLLSCRKPGSGEPHGPPSPSLTPALVPLCARQRQRSNRRRPLVTCTTHRAGKDNGRPYSLRPGAGDCSSTLLVQAVPHASTRTEASSLGSGCGRCFHTPPVAHFRPRTPCLSGSLNRT